MSSSDFQKSLINRFQVIFSLVIDGCFLFGWRGLTVGVNHLLNVWKIEGSVNIFTANALEWLFAIFTLIPVASFLLKDAWLSVKQVWGLGNNGE